MIAPHARDGALGMAGVVVANVILGTSSMFWHALGNVPPTTLIGYRILVSLVTLCAALALLGRARAALATASNARLVLIHLAAAILVCLNWLTFIWGSIHGRVIETGLGYLIAPAVTIALGAVVMRERLGRVRTAALAVCLLGVVLLILRSSELEWWVYVTIGTTWGMYSFLKKLTTADPVTGLTLEDRTARHRHRRGGRALVLLARPGAGRGRDRDRPAGDMWPGVGDAVVADFLRRQEDHADRVGVPAVRPADDPVRRGADLLRPGAVGQHGAVLRRGVAVADLDRRRFRAPRAPDPPLAGADHWDTYWDTRGDIRGKDPPAMNCDVLVVGAGVFGAATTWALAERGARVLVVDAHGPTHRYGSSHGENRIFRRAYWEGGVYLPMLNRADALWTELEETCGDTLVMRTGGVFIGSEESGVVDLSRRTARLGGIEHEVWDAARLAERFPWFGVGDGMTALYEPGAYSIFATRARLAMLDAAVRRQAGVRFGAEVVRVVPTGDGVDRAAALRRDDLRAVPSFWPPARGCRGHWLRASSTSSHPCVSRSTGSGRTPALGVDGFPAFLYETAAGEVVYGVPEGDVVKIGFHNRQQQPADPRDVAPPPVTPRLRKEIAAMVARIFTGIDPEPVRWRQCYYTLTPDGSFVIDRSSADHRIVHASACSGHGFKFATAVGECAAALALDEPPPVDLAPFTAARFPAVTLDPRPSPRT